MRWLARDKKLEAHREKEGGGGSLEEDTYAYNALPTIDGWAQDLGIGFSLMGNNWSPCLSF